MTASKTGLEIVGVSAFTDNYLWLVHDHDSGETVVVDPGDAAPVLAEASGRGWSIGQIWNTHWHGDHTGGNASVVAATGASLSAPAAECDRIAGVDCRLREGDTVQIGRHVGEVWEVPGHTSGHIALIFREAQIAFVGDTLFAMGCGRLFEGTTDQMHAALQRLAKLPDEMLVYCAHEYTLANARFAVHAFPEDAAIVERLHEIVALRDAGRPTVPTTIGAERATNPFVRAADAATFAQLRSAKDSYP